MKDDNDKITALHIVVDECEHGHHYISDVQPIRESDVAYSAPDADRILRSSKSLGWRGGRYDANWNATFGEKTPAEDIAN